MAGVVVPFRRDGAKSRLGLGPKVAHAMLQDVLAAAVPIGPVVVADADGGQGAAVAAELARLPDEAVLVVNADLPCVKAGDLLLLLGSRPPDGLSLVEAADGTTNALALSSPRLFADLYGAGSAERFRAHAPSVSVALPNLADDVDTVDDLVRVRSRIGPYTAATLLGVPS